MANERNAIIAEMRNRGAEHWGFKDTRTLFTLPFWLEAIEAPRFIGTFRHPHRVALSLHSRDQSPVEAGWELWYIYNIRLLELAQLYEFPLVNFDQPDARYIENVLARLVELGLDPGLADKGRAFFDPKLRNQSSVSVDKARLPTKVSELYERLLAYNNG
jgi:hypothetical protein